MPLGKHERPNKASVDAKLRGRIPGFPGQKLARVRKDSSGKTLLQLDAAGRNPAGCALRTHGK
eukprot:9481056-Pyramimonas_sp.AAC.1